MSTQISPDANGHAPGNNGGGEGKGALADALGSVDAERLARGLGWFSIGLGLAEVLAPGGIAKISGVSRKNTGLIRLLGLREIAHGVGIFSQGRRPTEALWARVVGDALDLACMGAAFASPKTKKGRLAFATANVLAVTALDVLCAQQLSSGEGSSDAKRGTTQVKNSLIINRAPEELYQYWHDFENLPNIMKHLERVRTTGERRSHWVAKAPAGTTVEWDAEVYNEKENELIAWRTLEGSQVSSAGSVRFESEPHGGTVVRVALKYDPPGGKLGSLVAWLFGENPEQQIEEDLGRFKQLMETGNASSNAGQTTGRGASAGR